MTNMTRREYGLAPLNPETIAHYEERIEQREYGGETTRWQIEQKDTQPNDMHKRLLDKVFHLPDCAHTTVQLQLIIGGIMTAFETLSESCCQKHQSLWKRAAQTLILNAMQAVDAPLPTALGTFQ